jgi:hypothetical protein
VNLLIGPFCHFCWNEFIFFSLVLSLKVDLKSDDEKKTEVSNLIGKRDVFKILLLLDSKKIFLELL